MSRASEPAPIKPLAEGELREAVARIVRGWSLPPEGQRIGPGTKRAIEEADAKAAEILAALPIQPSRPQGEEGLPEQLRGPYFPDEMGTFNAHGWGFGIRVPDEWWGIDTDDVPEEVKQLADTLERTIRAALSNQGKPSS